jgi:hypothetical protein
MHGPIGKPLQSSPTLYDGHNFFQRIGKTKTHFNEMWTVDQTLGLASVGGWLLSQCKEDRALSGKRKGGWTAIQLRRRSGFSR